MDKCTQEELLYVMEGMVKKTLSFIGAVVVENKKFYYVCYWDF